jgi:hypothetical protein
LLPRLYYQAAISHAAYFLSELEDDPVFVSDDFVSELFVSDDFDSDDFESEDVESEDLLSDDDEPSDLPLLFPAPPDFLA